MEPTEGVGILRKLLREYRITKTDLGKAIELAKTVSPSVAYRTALQYFRIERFDHKDVLIFGRCTQLLAVARRDYRSEVFEAYCEELRRIADDLETWVKPLQYVQYHIERHFKASGVLGATIVKWQDLDAMLKDPVVAQFITNLQLQIDPTSRKIQCFDMVYPHYVGFEGIVRVSDIPEIYKVWREVRDNCTVQVTNMPAPPSRCIRFLVAPKIDCWLVINCFARGRGSVGSPTDPRHGHEWAFFNLR